MSTPLNAPGSLLPPGPDTQPRTASGGQDDSHRQAWAREMERAQRDTWFKGQPLAPRATTASVDAGGPRRGARPAQAAAAQAAPRAFAPTHRTAQATRTTATAIAPNGTRAAAPQGPVAAAPASRPAGPAPSLAPTVMAPPFASAMRAAAWPIPLEDARRVPEPPPALSPPEHLPARLHAEWQGDSVRIWLGVDGPLADDAPHLVALVTAWLRRQGLRASSIVCNGRTLQDDPGAAAAPSHRQAGRDDVTAASTLLDIVASRSP